MLFEAFSGDKKIMYTLKVGFTIVNNLLQHRGLDCHLILQTVSWNYSIESLVSVKDDVGQPTTYD